MITVSQDPAAHVFYEMDWNEWLVSRSYTEDQIDSFAWTIEGPGTITNTRQVGAVVTVWVKDIAAAKKSTLTCTITMPAPTPSTPAITDDYSFAIFGKHR